MQTHALNQQLAQNADEWVDVVFLGDSITERWRETEYGTPASSALGSAEIFDSFFSKDKGGEYSGLALGISGDTVRRSQPNPSQSFSCFLTGIVFVPVTYASLETTEWGNSCQSQSICFLVACWNE